MTQNIKQTISEIVAFPSGISVGLSTESGMVVTTSAGVDPATIARTPIGECVRVDINPDNALSALFVELLGWVRDLSKLKLVQDHQEILAVFEHRAEGIIIFLPAPRDT